MSSTTTFTGNIGKKPELRTTSTDQSVVTLRVYVPQYELKDGQPTEVPDAGEWVSVNCWDNLAAQAMSLDKGMRIKVTGRMHLREYTTKDDEKRAELSVHARNIDVPLSTVVKHFGHSDSPAPKTDEAMSPASESEASNEYRNVDADDHEQVIET